MPFIPYPARRFEKLSPSPVERLVIFGREDLPDFLILHDSPISREHFGIERDDQGRFNLIDLGSANGTFLNGRRLESNAIRWLKQGDVVRAGRQEFTFREKVQRASTGGLMTDVMQDLQKGKGYHTIMGEIIGARVKKKIDPPA
jgi:pSer/pThr/pTyr-binding forkhead associated (FHA) protein